ncbi:LytR C-terminal domain-containing protein [Arthrobacter pityocampae]|uniref:LytR C-terminal domain-containing protein n=1 Tax=Arthrobacter pityocampae TaxID=547334 RepID=UPI003734F88D
MTEHPRDEFDRVPATSARQGVHRERFIPARSNGLGLKITVGVLALLVGLGSYFVLPRLGFPGGDDGGAAASSGASATAEPSSSASPGATSATSEPSATATATASAAADAADRAQTVNVLNGTGSPGLATVAASRLAAAGWTSALPGNWAGVPVDASVVFYNGEEQRAGAEAVAADLDIENLVESADISPAISVVLGPEFK